MVIGHSIGHPEKNSGKAKPWSIHTSIPKAYSIVTPHDTNPGKSQISTYRPRREQVRQSMIKTFINDHKMGGGGISMLQPRVKGDGDFRPTITSKLIGTTDPIKSLTITSGYSTKLSSSNGTKMLILQNEDN